MIRRPPCSTRTDPPCPDPTLFRSRLPVSDAREGIWRHGLTLAERLKYAMKHRLDSIKNIIRRDEAHFEIKLVEFARRTIGTGVFVTKARRDLEIAIEKIGRAHV